MSIARGVLVERSYSVAQAGWPFTRSGLFSVLSITYTLLLCPRKTCGGVSSVVGHSLAVRISKRCAVDLAAAAPVRCPGAYGGGHRGRAPRRSSRVAQTTSARPAATASRPRQRKTLQPPWPPVAASVGARNAKQRAVATRRNELVRKGAQGEGEGARTCWALTPELPTISNVLSAGTAVTAADERSRASAEASGLTVGRRMSRR